MGFNQASFAVHFERILGSFARSMTASARPPPRRSRRLSTPNASAAENSPSRSIAMLSFSLLHLLQATSCRPPQTSPPRPRRPSSPLPPPDRSVDLPRPPLCAPPPFRRTQSCTPAGRAAPPPPSPAPRNPPRPRRPHHPTRALRLPAQAQDSATAPARSPLTRLSPRRHRTVRRRGWRSLRAQAALGSAPGRAGAAVSAVRRGRTGSAGTDSRGGVWLAWCVRPVSSSISTANAPPPPLSPPRSRRPSSCWFFLRRGRSARASSHSCSVGTGTTDSTRRWQLQRWSAPPPPTAQRPAQKHNAAPSLLLCGWIRGPEPA